MATTVGQHQVSTITDPADGSAMVASVMRGVSSALRTEINAHDNDPGVHLQSSAASSRPAAGTAGRKWLDTDTLHIKYDNGVSWDDLNYLKVSSGTVSGAVTFANAVTVSSGGVTVTGNSTITGTLSGLTGLTVASGGASITGNSTLTGTLGGLTGLTVASGGASIGGDVTVSGTLSVSGNQLGVRGVTYTWPSGDGSSGYVLQTNGSGTLSWVSVASAGGVAGTGTTNKVAYWTGGDSIGAASYNVGDVALKSASASFTTLTGSTSVTTPELIVQKSGTTQEYLTVVHTHDNGNLLTRSTFKNNPRSASYNAWYDFTNENTGQSVRVNVDNTQSASGYYVNGTKVVGARGSAITSPTGGGTIDSEARTAIGDILSALRTHGLIAT